MDIRKRILRMVLGTAILLAGQLFAAIPVSAGQTPVMIDQRGRAFTFASLRGMPVAVTFIAAHCKDACPLINAQFAQASKEFERDGMHVRLLTITLDPEHDPPSVMRGVARRFDADPRRWLVAGGSVRDVHRIMDAFGVTAEQGEHGYAEVHTTFVYILDGSGRLRKTMLASAQLAAQLADEVRRK